MLNLQLLLFHQLLSFCHDCFYYTFRHSTCLSISNHLCVFCVCAESRARRFNTPRVRLPLYYAMVKTNGILIWVLRMDEKYKYCILCQGWNNLSLCEVVASFSLTYRFCEKDILINNELLFSLMPIHILTHPHLYVGSCIAFLYACPGSTIRRFEELSCKTC